MQNHLFRQSSARNVCEVSDSSLYLDESHIMCLLTYECNPYSMLSGWHILKHSDILQLLYIARYHTLSTVRYLSLCNVQTGRWLYRQIIGLIKGGACCIGVGTNPGCCHTHVFHNFISFLLIKSLMDIVLCVLAFLVLLASTCRHGPRQRSLSRNYHAAAGAHRSRQSRQRTGRGGLCSGLSGSRQQIDWGHLDYITWLNFSVNLNSSPSLSCGFTI